MRCSLVLLSAVLSSTGLALAQETRPRDIQVGVWYLPSAQVPSPRFERAVPRDPARVDAWLAALRRDYRENFCRLARDPFTARMHAAGLRVVYASCFAPAAVVAGSPAAVEQLRRIGGVLQVFAPVRYEVETDISGKTTRADAIARLPVPVTGKGVKVCVLEAQSVQAANPYIPAVTYYTTPPTVPYTVPYGKHPTAVAGIIVSSHTQYRGVAPGATLLNANAGSFTQTNILRASDWAIKQGANTMNASFGSNTQGALRLMDHYFDHVIRHLLVNFIKGAGNTRSYVVSPGLGFNSITVGNSNHNKTPHWADDAMHAASGYLDPTTGHPKPEVVAPGTNLTGTLHTSPWIGVIGSGGSYAGPQGNGVAALLMERNPKLKLQPAAIKAVIMASAWHVGQIHALAADAIVRGGTGRLHYGNLKTTSFDPSGNLDIKLRLEASSLTRVALSWLSDPANTLKMDLDLYVLDPLGKPVTSAVGRNRGFEIARFMPQTSGTYTFRLRKVSFLGSDEPYALAVSQIQDTAAAWISGAANLPLGKTSTFTLNDPYHKNHAYGVGASLSGGSFANGTPFGNRLVPLVVDVATWLSVTPGGGGIFSGNFGKLDANGQATIKVTLPQITAFLGLDLTQAGLTFATVGTEAVEMTPPLKRRIVK
ncbi:MAG: S8 family peptidase [Planctomycetota bacterium]